MRARIGVAFEGEQAYLGSVSVGDDDVMIATKRRKRLDGAQNVVLLDRRIRSLAALEERVAAKRRDDAHLSFRASRPSPP